MNSSKKRLLVFSSFFLLVIGAFFGGLYTGYDARPEIEKVFSLTHNEALASSTPADFSPFWKAWNVINEKFVDSGKVTDQEKVWGAISGLADSLNDPYTVFMPPEEAKEFESEIRGNFEGVGMEIGIKEGVLTVIAPIKGSPAEKAGVKKGDKILKIGDSVTSTLTVDEAVRLIRGPKGTSVVFTIMRGGKVEPLVIITVLRDVITIPTIDTELRSDGIYVITLHNFSAVSSKLFDQAMQSFLKSQSAKLVLDLRGNPGGYLDASVDMASWFLPKGKVVVREDFGGNREENAYRSTGNTKIPSNLQMIVLIDDGSASASEILAGALQEYGIAKLVGTKTFGKGSVQELVKITPETNLKVTIARWLTPNRKSISEGGLTPDVEVKMTEDDAKNERDPQMEKAVELLKQ